MEDKNKKFEIIDLDIKNITPYMDQLDLKQISGAKHIISTEIGHNSMKGHNSGDARIKFRINEGDSYDQVLYNLKNKGFIVSQHKKDGERKPTMQIKDIQILRVQKNQNLSEIKNFSRKK